MPFVCHLHDKREARDNLNVKAAVNCLFNHLKKIVNLSQNMPRERREAETEDICRSWNRTRLEISGGSWGVAEFSGEGWFPLHPPNSYGEISAGEGQIAIKQLDASEP